MKPLIEEAGVVVHPEIFPQSVLCNRTIVVGDVLELIPEPSNPIDPSAVRVQWKGVPIGYLANTGKSCEQCTARMMSKSSRCSNCGSFDWVPQGLAYRVLARGWLETDYLCVVEKVLSDSKLPIHFRLYCIL